MSDHSPILSAATRAATLAALRDRLAGILDGSVGHERGCTCECGMPWDAGKVAGLARELRETIRELDELPAETGGTEIDDIQAARDRRRQQADSEGRTG